MVCPPGPGTTARSTNLIARLIATLCRLILHHAYLRSGYMPEASLHSARMNIDTKQGQSRLKQLILKEGSTTDIPYSIKYQHACYIKVSCDCGTSDFRRIWHPPPFGTISTCPAELKGTNHTHQSYFASYIQVTLQGFISPNYLMNQTVLSKSPISYTPQKINHRTSK